MIAPLLKGPSKRKKDPDSSQSSLCTFDSLFQTAMIIDMLVQASSDLETHFVSVERIKEYAKVTPEAPWEIPDSKPAEDWPQTGRVHVNKYSTRYRPGLDLVLNDLSFEVQPNEKVGYF